MKKKILFHFAINGKILFYTRYNNCYVFQNATSFQLSSYTHGFLDEMDETTKFKKKENS